MSFVNLFKNNFLHVCLYLFSFSSDGTPFGTSFRSLSCATYDLSSYATAYPSRSPRCSCQSKAYPLRAAPCSCPSRPHPGLCVGPFGPPTGTIFFDRNPMSKRSITLDVNSHNRNRIGIFGCFTSNPTSSDDTCFGASAEASSPVSY